MALIVNFYRTAAGVNNHVPVIDSLETTCTLGTTKKKIPKEVFVNWNSGTNRWDEVTVFTPGTTLVLLRIDNPCNGTYEYVGNLRIEDARQLIECCANDNGPFILQVSGVNATGANELSLKYGKKFNDYRFSEGELTYDYVELILPYPLGALADDPNRYLYIDIDTTMVWVLAPLTLLEVIDATHVRVKATIDLSFAYVADSILNFRPIKTVDIRRNGRKFELSDFRPDAYVPSSVTLIESVGGASALFWGLDDIFPIHLIGVKDDYVGPSLLSFGYGNLSLPVGKTLQINTNIPGLVSSVGYVTNVNGAGVHFFVSNISAQNIPIDGSWYIDLIDVG
jgi:hypothetical protein